MKDFSAWDLLETRTVLLAAVVFLVVFRLLRRPRNLPPGPWGWPLVGNLPGLMTSGEEMHVTLSKMSARYGRVIRLNLAGIQVVFLNGFATVKEAFAMPQLSDRPTAHITKIVQPGIGIVNSSGDVTSEIRRFTLSVLRGFGVGKSSFEQKIVAEADGMLDELKKYEGEAFDPKHVVGKAVSNVICAVVFGKRFRYDDPAFEGLLQSLDDAMAQSGAGCLFQFVPIFTRLRMLPFVRAYINTLTDFFGRIGGLLRDHSRCQDPDSPRDFVDSFLNEKESRERRGAASPPFLRAENLVHIVGDLFGGGSETTATTLRWAMLYMMTHPEVEARVQRELDGVTARNRFPRISDKPSLPYTEAVLCEIQRVATIAPLTIPHRCSEDTKVFGYDIPKGTIIIGNMWHHHFDRDLWEEPTRFRPERFLDDGGNFRPREELTPFGTGRRICVGENLARMELFIFYTRLLHQFTIKKPDDVHSVSFEGINGTVWSPKNFNICAIARDDLGAA